MAATGHLTEGHGFRVSLETQALTFYEKSVTVQGVEGGDPIPITTNDNADYESFAPRALKTKTGITLQCTYDKALFASYKAAVNVEDTILVIYSDDTTEDAEPGWLRSVIPDNAEGGAQPMLTCIFEFQGEAPA